MSIEFEKGLNTEELLKKIDETIQRKQLDLFLWHKIHHIAFNYAGKKITKRIETELRNTPSLKDFTIYLDKDDGKGSCRLPRVSIWGNGIEYDHRFVSYLGHDKMILNLKMTIASNQCYILDKERIERLEEGKPQVPGLVNLWNDALQGLKDVNKCAEKYELQYDFDLNIKRY